MSIERAIGRLDGTTEWKTPAWSNPCDKVVCVFPMLSFALSQSWTTIEKTNPTVALSVKNWSRKSHLNSLSWWDPKPVQPTGKNEDFPSVLFFLIFSWPHTIQGKLPWRSIFQGLSYGITPGHDCAGFGSHQESEFKWMLWIMFLHWERRSSSFFSALVRGWDNAKASLD